MSEIGQVKQEILDAIKVALKGDKNAGGPIDNAREAEHLTSAYKNLVDAEASSAYSFPAAKAASAN